MIYFFDPIGHSVHSALTPKTKPNHSHGVIKGDYLLRTPADKACFFAIVCRLCCIKIIVTMADDC